VINFSVDLKTRNEQQAQEQVQARLTANGTHIGGSQDAHGPLPAVYARDS